MAKSIKHFCTVFLVSVSTILCTGYIASVQATQEAVVEKRVLQDKIESGWKSEANHYMRFIQTTLKKNKNEQSDLYKKLQKLLNFSLKEHKKYFFKLPVDQLQLIFPKIKDLRSLYEKFGMGLLELMDQIYQGKVKKEIEAKSTADEISQKEVVEEIKLVFHEIIQILDEKGETSDSIFSCNDQELMHNRGFFMFQEMQKTALECSFMQQQSFLPQLKEIRRLIQKLVEADKALMATIPGTLKKNLHKLAKKISQSVHAMLSTCTEPDQAAYIAAHMMFFNK
ncbi:hypothetical protein ACRRVD_02535 [Candidatus Cardinium hertigii]|uniref:hypothetical protein n=1 Tax=Candidatus Cardinium hertigii TaxID=247481 RepID=UPI003D7E7170